jgi:hypothetical protein
MAFLLDCILDIRASSVSSSSRCSPRRRSETQRSRDHSTKKVFTGCQSSSASITNCAYTHAQSEHWSSPRVYMTDMVTACSAVSLLARLRSSTSGNYITPRTIRKLGERVFSVSAPSLWNTLPNDITSTQCTTTFKRLLKTHLYKSVYHL